MARTLEFDRSEVLNKALVLFWRKGYQATSLSDLLEAMRISRGSLYLAFGDKRSLYIECLDIFAFRTMEILVKARKEHSPAKALRIFFESTASGQGGHRSSWGCMLVNTVLELAGVDHELSARASMLLAAIQDQFQKCLLDSGVLPDRAVEISSFLMVFNEGIRVSSRRKVSVEQQLSDIDTTFRLIGITA